MRNPNLKSKNATNGSSRRSAQLQLSLPADAFLGLLSEEQPGIPPAMLFANAGIAQVQGNTSPDGGVEPVALKAVKLKLMNFSLAVRVTPMRVME